MALKNNWANGDTFTPNDANQMADAANLIISISSPEKISRLVCTTAASTAVNQWAKIASFASPTAGSASTLLLAFNATRTNSSASSIIASIYATYNSGTSGAAGLSSVEIIGGSGIYGLMPTGVKIISNGYGNPHEVWIKTTDAGVTVTVFELNRRITSTNNSVTYNDGATWQSSEPTGSVTNVVSAGVTAFSVPVVTRISVPATATSTGVVGQTAADASYFYVCTAANTWRRQALTSW
jgi:hypothetical protein